MTSKCVTFVSSGSSARSAAATASGASISRSWKIPSSISNTRYRPASAPAGSSPEIVTPRTVAVPGNEPPDKARSAAPQRRRPPSNATGTATVAQGPACHSRLRSTPHPQSAGVRRIGILTGRDVKWLFPTGSPLGNNHFGRRAGSVRGFGGRRVFGGRECVAPWRVLGFHGGARRDELVQCVADRSRGFPAQ